MERSNPRPSAPERPTSIRRMVRPTLLHPSSAPEPRTLSTVSSELDADKPAYAQARRCIARGRSALRAWSSLALAKEGYGRDTRIFGSEQLKEFCKGAYSYGTRTDSLICSALRADRRGPGARSIRRPGGKPPRGAADLTGPDRRHHRLLYVPQLRGGACG